MVVHADLINWGPAEEHNLKYVLIIKHDISSYTCLCPCDSADSDAATTAIAKWLTFFGVMYWLVADQGSHFEESLMENVAPNMHI